MCMVASRLSKSESKDFGAQSLAPFLCVRVCVFWFTDLAPSKTQTHTCTPKVRATVFWRHELTWRTGGATRYGQYNQPKLPPRLRWHNLGILVCSTLAIPFPIPIPCHAVWYSSFSWTFSFCAAEASTCSKWKRWLWRHTRVEYCPMGMTSGARFTNDLLSAIQIRWTLRLAIIPLPAIRSQQIFAHASCRVMCKIW